MYQATCPFCEPKVQEAKFAESKNFIAIYNISPILPGHSLIIPKRHIASLMALDDSELCEMMIFSKNIVKILLRAFGVNAFNWTIQEGEEAGQTISHLHLHLIPRKQGDLPQPGDWYPRLRESQSNVIDSEERQRLLPQEMRRVVDKIKATAREINPSILLPK
jgi:bis(5'-adenosyl)-triphosphatase